MKLRIQESKITLRLSIEEVHLLSARRKINQSMNLRGGSVNIVLEVNSEEEIDLHYADGVYSFAFPERHLQEWRESNKVGYHRNLGDIDLTIEKDLPKRNISHG